MKSFQQTYSIAAQLPEVWRAFVDPTVIQAWGGGPAEMEAEENAKFSLWNGQVYGVNTKVIPERLLEQDWYGGKDWQQPSKVSFSFEMDGFVTLVSLSHEQIPDEAAAEVEAGWSESFIGPMQALLEQPPGPRPEE